VDGIFTNARFEITGTGSGSYGYELWSSKNNHTETADIPSGQSTTSVSIDFEDWYMIDVYPAATGVGGVTEWAGGSVADAQSETYNDYEIQYNLYDENGNLADTITAKTDGVELGSPYSFKADDTVIHNNEEYKLSGTASTMIHFGQSIYSFDYQVYTPGDRTAYVYYRDQRGNILNVTAVTIPYGSSDVQFTVDAAWTDPESGRTYTKVSNVNTLTWNYNSNDLDYDVIYEIDPDPQTGDYMVRVDFVDEADNSISLGREYLRLREGEAGAAYSCPPTLTVVSGGTTTYYEVVPEQQNITHLYDDSTRIYTVEYRKFNEQSSYDWVIEFRDMATNTTIGSETVTVQPGSAVTYSPNAQVEYNGETYILDAGMQKDYSHQYGQGSRILYLFYNQSGIDNPASIDISISCRSVSDNYELLSTTLTAAPGTAASFTMPESFEANGTEYILLDGQANADGSLDVEYSYYTPRRTDTFYYRDVNDLDNADTYVTRTEIITSVVYEDVVETTTQTVEETITNTRNITAAGRTTTAGGAAGTSTGAAATTTGTNLTNEGTGENAVLTDEGVPLSEYREEEEAPGQQVIEDDDVPLAAPEDKDQGIIAAAGAHPWALAGGTAGIAGIIALAYYLIRKRSGRDLNNDA